MSRNGTETDGETDQHISSATQSADEEATDIFNVPETEMETNSDQIHPGHLEDENPSPMEIESNDNAEEVVIPETQFPTSSIITSDEEDIEISGQPLTTSTPNAEAR